MAARLLAAVVLVVVAAVAFVDGRAPAPVPDDAPASAFSAQRAVRTVSELAREPHPLGSPASDRVRDDLVQRLTAAGLDTRLQASVGARAGSGSLSAAAVENVVATLPGTAPTGAVVLAAHYDSVPTGPGAADDMSSVASILETVRALRTGPPLRNDLIVLITDGEEAGLLGAQAWVRDELIPSRRPTVTLNFEARGVSGPSLMFQTSPGNAELVRTFVDAVPHPTGDSSLVEAYKFLPNDTDLTTVLQAGRPGLNFAFVDGANEYHTTGDSPANLDPASVQGHGDAALGLARALGGRDLGPLDPAASGAPRSGDETYFRFLATSVTYPGSVVWPLAGLAGLAVVGAAVLARSRRLLSVPRTLGAAVAVLVAAAVGVVVAIGLWRGLIALRPSYADTGPFLGRQLPFQLADVALAVLVAALWYLPVRRWAGRDAAAAGSVLVLAVLGIGTAAAAPGVSFLFAWPALGLGIGQILAVLLRARPAAATIVRALGAVPAAVLLVPFGWSLFSAAAVSDGVAVAAFVLVAASLAPVVDVPPVRRSWAVPATAVVLVIALAGAGLLVDRPSPEHPQAAHLAFVQEADTGAAWWVSADTAPDPWTDRYLDAGPSTLPAWPGSTAVRRGGAIALPVPGPTATVLERAPGRLVLQVTSPRGAPTMVLRADRPLASVTLTWPGRAPVSANPDGAQIRLAAVPAAGVRVELVPAAPGPLAVTASDLSPGLAGVPDFTARPPELRVSPRRDSDQVVVTRRVG